MTPEQIKANAPEGSTHYLFHDEVVYYKYDGHSGLQAWTRNGWCYCHNPEEKFDMDKYSDVIKPL